MKLKNFFFYGMILRFLIEIASNILKNIKNKTHAHLFKGFT